MQQKLSKKLFQFISKKRIVSENDIYKLSKKFKTSPEKVIKTLDFLQEKNKIQKVWLDEDEKISPLKTWKEGFIVNIKNKPAPILTNDEIDKILN